MVDRLVKRTEQSWKTLNAMAAYCRKRCARDERERADTERDRAGRERTQRGKRGERGARRERERRESVREKRA